MRQGLQHADSDQMVPLVDARWSAYLHGIGRFSREIMSRMPRSVHLPLKLHHLHPLNPIAVSWQLQLLKPPVYFSPGFNPPLWSKVPFVFTIGDLIHLRFPEESGVGKAAYYRWIVQPAARRAYKVLTFSEFSKQQIIEAFGIPPAKVAVVGCGVGPEFSLDGPVHEPGYRYLLCVGSDKPHKNLALLLRAFANSDLDQEVRLIMFGGVSDDLLRLRQELGLESRVVLPGFVADQQLPSYYRGATALIFASLYEGFGLPPLEAMASGIPVVASPLTSLGEVVGEAALMIDPHDVESLAWGIHKIVADVALREELRAKGLRRAAQFTWDRTAALTWQVLREAALS